MKSDLSHFLTNHSCTHNKYLFRIANNMKIIALLLALFAVVRADRGWNIPKGLNVRGGADLGPLDNALAMKLAKTATVAYAAGSGSKYIASQTGGSNTQVR
jgi:hypothetical protein